MNNYEQDLKNIFWTGDSKNKYLFIIVAHPDDFEIGCLGTILKLKESSVDFTIKLLTFCASNEIRKKEQEASIKILNELGVKIELVMFNYVDTVLLESISNIKKEIQKYENKLKDLGADICVITHHCNDKHQDHACVNKAVIQTLRNHRVITFNILKYEEERFIASFYVSLNGYIIQNKVTHILKNFPSQHSKNWFREEVFLSQLRVQGVHANCEFAEVFSIEKMCI
jgi:LmbE family N-acetylglucosaminyl deacetylase